MQFDFFRVNKKVVVLSRKTILEANLVFARQPQLEFATIGVTTLQSHDSCCRRRWQSEVSTEWGRKLWSWGAACSDLETFEVNLGSASQQPPTLAWHKLHPHRASKATLSSRGKCQDFGSLQSQLMAVAVDARAFWWLCHNLTFLSMDFKKLQFQSFQTFCIRGGKSQSKSPIFIYILCGHFPHTNMNMNQID